VWGPNEEGVEEIVTNNPPKMTERQHISIIPDQNETLLLREDYELFAPGKIPESAPSDSNSRDLDGLSALAV